MYYDYAQLKNFKSRWTLGKSILVVDDEPMARTLLRLMLVRSGYEVVEAFDGIDALEKIASHRIDLVILDVMMPGMDGFDVCRTIRANADYEHIPVIMLSAKNDLQSTKQGLKAGAVKYLTKPVVPEDLVRHVHEVATGIANQQTS